MSPLNLGTVAYGMAGSIVVLLFVTAGATLFLNHDKECWPAESNTTPRSGH